MQVYTIHEPPEPPADRIDRAGSLRFIGDRFVPQAVAFGPFWLLGHRLWLAFAGYVTAALLVATVVLLAGLSWRWLSLMVGAFNLFLAFEGPSLQRWALERQGWRTLGTVSGRTLDECERRFLESYLADQRLGATGSVSMASPSGAGARLSGAASGDNLNGRLAGARRGWLPWRTRTSAT